MSKYGPIEQYDDDNDDADSRGASPRVPPHAHNQPLASPTSSPSLSTLFLEHHDTSFSAENSPPINTLGLHSMFRSVTSKSTRTTASYDMVEEEDFEDLRTSPSLTPATATATATATTTIQERSESPHRGDILRPRRHSPATAADSSILPPPLTPHSESIVHRAASGTRFHPKPDLQTLQGAYLGNIEHLDRMAEQLSEAGSIDDAIRELRDEQKRSESRRSSLLSSQGLGLARQVSGTSIVEVNSAARSGGYSPAGFMMSPKGSFTASTAGGRGRSASKSSRFGQRFEPELEGRPLDSFVTMKSSVIIPPASPVASRSDSRTEQEGISSALSRPTGDLLASPQMDNGDGMPARKTTESDRPSTSASMTNEEKMFAGFDGVHAEEPEEPDFVLPDFDYLGGPAQQAAFDPPSAQRRLSGAGSMHSDPDKTQRRASSGNRLSQANMQRPQSYADPTTGQEMVYYPAPVPMMLNLPQKLSNKPSATARNKRRSQILSSVPPAARQSAIWLPDVLENEEDRDLSVDPETEQQEYVAQHQRASMGGRRLTQDLAHMPPQLRASTFFELPGPNETVELKEQSAVATLDSILDASAHAPVSAFTDHAFAGALGPEVYGKINHARNASRGTTQLFEAPVQKKRTSSFGGLLIGRRASKVDLLNVEKDKRASTMSGAMEGAVRAPLDDEEDEDHVKDTTPLQRSVVDDNEDSGSDQGQRDDEVYHGPPTTLLAELQLRKQQQKQRTQKVYPQGMHSTLLEIDAVAQVEQKTRKTKRTRLAWEDPHYENEGGDGDDEDVPLGVLFAKKSQMRDMMSRPMGLMERREMEDNEPLSQRRTRLQGRPAVAPHASSMANLTGPPAPSEDEEETLAQRAQRIKEQNGTAPDLLGPTARPVSGDFASEMMSQFGGELLDKGKGKEIPGSPPPEEEETLGQRRKRLQAEREARAKEVGTAGEADVAPQLKPRRSLADLLSAHPQAGSADRIMSYQKPAGGLLAMHDRQNEKQHAARANTMMNLDSQNMPAPQRAVSGGFRAGQYNDAKGGIIPPQQQGHNMYGQQPLFPQPSLGYNQYSQNAYQSPMMMPFSNPYAQNVGYSQGMMQPTPAMNIQSYTQAMNSMQASQLNMMQMQGQPLNQGQTDMVERWRQSVMQ